MEEVLWIEEMEMAEPVDDLRTSQLIGGRRFPNLEALDTKITSALKKIIMNFNSNKKVCLEEQKAQMEHQFPSG